MFLDIIKENYNSGNIELNWFYVQSLRLLKDIILNEKMQLSSDNLGYFASCFLDSELFFLIIDFAGYKKDI